MSLRQKVGAFLRIVYYYLILPASTTNVADIDNGGWNNFFMFLAIFVFPRKKML